jgi:hypothetical protein
VRTAGAAVPAIYQSLAAETGGRVLLAAGDRLPTAFAVLLDEFRSSYVLHFTPKSRDSGFHALGVRVTKPGPFEVRARRGYFN